MIYEGINGQVLIESDGIRISPKGRMSDIVDCFLAFSEISQVSCKPASAWKPGKFVVGSSSETRQITFLKNQSSQFEQLSHQLAELDAGRLSEWAMDELGRVDEATRARLQQELEKSDERLASQQAKDEVREAKESRRLANQQAKENQRLASQKAKDEAREAKNRKRFAGARSDILDAAARMTWTWGGRQEVRSLETYLDDTETVLEMAQGILEDKQGILVLTDKNVLFLFHGLINAHSENFPLSSISTISLKTSLGGSDITVHASGSSRVIKRVMQADAQRLTSAARPRVGKQPTVVNVTGGTATEPSVLDQLAQLSDLHKAGVLNDAEFATKKAALLERL